MFGIRPSPDVKTIVSPRTGIILATVGKMPQVVRRRLGRVVRTMMNSGSPGHRGGGVSNPRHNKHWERPTSLVKAQRMAKGKKAGR